MIVMLTHSTIEHFPAFFAQSFYVIIKECASEVSFHFREFGGTVYPIDTQHFSTLLAGPMQNERIFRNWL